MPILTTIEASVSQSAITKVTRLFNGTIDDVLQELLQNARRAGASEIRIELAGTDGEPALVIRDDGSGIADPGVLVTLGHSGWGADTARREDPAGMGVFSLAGRDVTVRSHSSVLGGWQVEIPADAWQGGVPLAVKPSAIARGTEIRLALPDAWAAGLQQAAKHAAQYFPLPVYFGGSLLPRQDFLAGALRIEHWHGCRIGVFRNKDHDGADVPRINFHGIRVPCRFPMVSEIGAFGKWTARVDIIDAPALQLVLPAHKEMVENAALAELRSAVAKAIYRTIGFEPSHRLSFKDWRQAVDLGIPLAEAEASLGAWIAVTADSHGREVGENVSNGPMLIMPPHEADIEQGLAQILGDRSPIGARLVAAEPAFEGYGWYDRLPRIAWLQFLIERKGEIHRYGEDQLLPDDYESGGVSSIAVELTIASSGGEHPDKRLHRFALPMLVCRNDGWDLDEAIILVAADGDVSPSALAWLIETSLFSAKDDHDCDSWETQQRNFEEAARDLATTLLLGEEEALLERIRIALGENVQWLIPDGRTLSLAATRQSLTITLAEAQ